MSVFNFEQMLESNDLQFNYFTTELFTNKEWESITMQMNIDGLVGLYNNEFPFEVGEIMDIADLESDPIKKTNSIITSSIDIFLKYIRKELIIDLYTIVYICSHLIFYCMELHVVEMIREDVDGARCDICIYDGECCECGEYLTLVQETFFKYFNLKNITNPLLNIQSKIINRMYERDLLDGMAIYLSNISNEIFDVMSNLTYDLSNLLNMKMNPMSSGSVVFFYKKGLLNFNTKVNSPSLMGNFIIVILKE